MTSLANCKRFPLIVALALLLGTAKPGPAAPAHSVAVAVQDNESWTGKRAMNRFASPNLWELTPKPRVIGKVDVAEVTVDRDENGYLFVRVLGQKGWVKKSDYVLSESAIPYFTERIEQNANDLFAYNQRGILWKEKKEYAKALADQSETIRINPKNPVYFHNRGVTYAGLQQHDKAIADFDEALRLNPKHLLAHRWRGLSYFALKEYDKALADYDRAIEINPKFAVLHVDRGNLWSAKRGLPRAVADFTEAIRLDPKEAAPLRLRGQAHRQLKEYTKARSDFDFAVKVNPKYAQAWADLGWLLAACHDPAIRDGKKAVSAAEKACELTAHKTPSYLTILAAAHAEAGNFEEAVRWQTRTLEFAAYTKSFPNLARNRLQLYEARKAYHEP